jgi:hypothetical protein
MEEGRGLVAGEARRRPVDHKAVILAHERQVRELRAVRSCAEEMSRPPALTGIQPLILGDARQRVRVSPGTQCTVRSGRGPELGRLLLELQRGPDAADPVGDGRQRDVQGVEDPVGPREDVPARLCAGLGQ